MVVGDTPNSAKTRKIVLKRAVVARPSDNVERRVFLTASPKRPHQFVNDEPAALIYFERCDRMFEVAFICESIRS